MNAPTPTDRLTLLILVAAASFTTSAGLQAATTIHTNHHFAWGANIGWIDGRGDVTNGAVLGEYVCSGFLFAANVGWIHLGNGSPANGIRYQNASGTDFGVNHDGLGNLRGLAWGANIGWINFHDQGAPTVDLASGALSGFVYSANCGWINLSNAVAHVRTDSITGGVDNDGDEIPDAWERETFGSLIAADASSDADGDGLSDQREYLADTNPLDAQDGLRITAVTRTEGTPPTLFLAWTSQPTRAYAVERRSALDPSSPWEDSYLLPWPSAGNAGFDLLGDRCFYRIRAFRPLAPSP